jgi:hypothetical protein
LAILVIIYGGMNFIQRVAPPDPQILIRNQNMKMFDNYTEYLINFSIVNTRDEPITLNELSFNVASPSSEIIADIDSMRDFRFDSIHNFKLHGSLMVNITSSNSSSSQWFFDKIGNTFSTNKYIIPITNKNGTCFSFLTFNDNFSKKIAIYNLSSNSNPEIKAFEIIGRRGVLNEHEQVDFYLTVDAYFPPQLNGKFPSIWSFGGTIILDYEDMSLKSRIIRYPRDTLIRINQ